MKNKVPRKLKKELRKVECVEMSKQPEFVRHFHTHPYGDSLTEGFVFKNTFRVKLKQGVKVNKWTKRLVRNIYREKKRAYKKMSEIAIERQMSWLKKGITPIDTYEEAMNSKSAQEFRREYMNEPVLPRDLDGLRPSCVIIDDMGEQWQPANRKEVEEFLRRCNIWPHAQEPDRNGNIILKLPSLSKEKLEEFKAEWEKWARSSQPITVIDPEASIEFIPAKRPHRLHNHPRMEVELGLNEREVIVDQEFVHLFKCVRPVRGIRHEVGVDHFIVSKKEFLERMEESRGATDEPDNLLRPRYEGESFEGSL